MPDSHDQNVPTHILNLVCAVRLRGHGYKGMVRGKVQGPLPLAAAGRITPSPSRLCTT